MHVEVKRSRLVVHRELAEIHLVKDDRLRIREEHEPGEEGKRREDDDLHGRATQTSAPARPRFVQLSTQHAAYLLIVRFIKLGPGTRGL
jgi:hypothetical protein